MRASWGGVSAARGSACRRRHELAGRAVLYGDPGDARRGRGQGRASPAWRRGACLGAAVLRRRQCALLRRELRQAVVGTRREARARGPPSPRRGRRRVPAEPPARHGEAARLRPGGAARAEPEARVLRHRRVRQDRAATGTRGLRPVVAGVRRAHERDRRTRPPGCPCRHVDRRSRHWDVGRAWRRRGAARRRRTNGRRLALRDRCRPAAVSVDRVSPRRRRHGTAFPLIAPYQVFHARDGDVMIAAANDGLFAKLCQTLDLAELVADPRFATNPDRLQRRDELAALIQARVSQRAGGDLLAALAEVGVPAAAVQDVGQVAEHEQTAALGLINDGRVSLPLSFDGARVAYRTPPPLLGEHTAEILQEAGYDEGEISALAREGIVRDPRLDT